MPEELSLDEQLRVLRETDEERRWYTVDDKRVCLICERVISGREIKIEGGPKEYSLGCPTPGCPGSFSHWLLYRPTRAELKDLEPDRAGEMDFLFAFKRPEPGEG